MTNTETINKAMYEALKEAQVIIDSLVRTHPQMKTWKNTPYKDQRDRIQNAIDIYDMSECLG